MITQIIPINQIITNASSMCSTLRLFAMLFVSFWKPRGFPTAAADKFIS
jgi:hypothetical protein